MEILVRVIAENTLTGEKKLTNQAFFTFVALDQNGKPSPVVPLKPESEEEIRLFKDALSRREKRLELKSNK